MDDLAAYRVIEREPVQVLYRGREVVTNPPPSAGGILIARALAMLDAGPAPPRRRAIVIAAMEQTQAARTHEFLEGLDDPGFGCSAFLARVRARARLDHPRRGDGSRRLGVLGDDRATARARA